MVACAEGQEGIELPHGGHEKGGQGKGQLVAAQWTTSAVGDDVGQKDVPLAERWGERMDSD